MVVAVVVVAVADGPRDVLLDIIILYSVCNIVFKDRVVYIAPYNYNILLHA